MPSLAPEVRAAICNGSCCSDMIGRLQEAILGGDRVLLVGTGFGVLSTLAGKIKDIRRVIALEADARLVPYLDQVHEKNGVPWVETLCAVPGDGRRGNARYFARRDPRDSSLSRDDGPWDEALLVPLVDLELLISEEEINVIVWDTPTAAADLLNDARLGKVDRIVVNQGKMKAQPPEAEVTSWMMRLGFITRDSGSARLYHRA